VQWNRTASRGAPSGNQFQGVATLCLEINASSGTDHRGNILLTLKLCGHRLPQADSYAIRDWDGM
jgi:hypothetical protein